MAKKKEKWGKVGRPDSKKRKDWMAHMRRMKKRGKK